MQLLTIEPSPVRLALEQHSVPALRRIGLEESETAVVLTGTVPSFYYKQLAQEAVLPLLAGRKLRNRLGVVRE
jgi:hypothetical protein